MHLITLPGLIDPHVHFRDPGETEKEDFFTGTAAALSGGYTAVLDMPNNKEPIFSLEKLQKKMQIAKEKTVADIGFYFGSLGDNTEEFAKVTHLVFGLKLYLGKTTGGYLLAENRLSTIYDSWHSDGGPIMVHAFADKLAAVLEQVKRTRKKTHVCHVIASDLPQIIRAKEEGLPVSCGVTPHHLFLTDKDAKQLGNYGFVKPAIGSKEDQNFLWEHLQYIDCVESDHAPHTKEEKQQQELYGFPGVETTLPLLLTAVAEKRITVEDIKRLCIENPARIFRINNYLENEITVDLDQEYEIKNSVLHTKSAWSPFAGRKVKGKVTKVGIKGKTVFENDLILAKPGDGEVLMND